MSGPVLALILVRIFSIFDLRIYQIRIINKRIEENIYRNLKREALEPGIAFWPTIEFFNSLIAHLAT